MARTRLAWASAVLPAIIGVLLPAAASAQAIIGTTDGGNQAVVFPSPAVGLPNPARTPVPGLPAGARPHGVAYYGSDNALVSDFSGARVFVIQISSATLLGTIVTTPCDGTGSIAVAPGLNFALMQGSGTTLCRISAPFGPGSTITPVTMPAAIAGYQTQAIVFNAAGRAFVYHTAGISVLDPPYTSIAFTIPVTGNGASGAIAITPDGNNLLVTDLSSGDVRIFTAPYSAGSTPVTLTITGASTLDGIMANPTGANVLVISAALPTLWAISPPYNATSTVDAITISAAVGSHEDVGISADGQLAILAGNGGADPDTAFVQAPFTTAGAVVSIVTITGGRGNGAVRFLPPGLAPGLTISKSGPSTATTGSNITYTITYGNTGAAAANGVVIRDPVPAGTTFVSATGGGTNVAGVVTWNIGTVNAGVTGQTVSFTVNVTAASGTVDNINYTIEGTGIAPIPGPPVFTQIGGVAPTATPTATATATATPTVTPGIPVNVPTLSFPMLALLAAALGIAALLLISRKM
ncbi:MAG: hypothetical protein ABR576_12975 [Thermoanaerobaculia bacterium]